MLWHVLSLSQTSLAVSFSFGVLHNNRYTEQSCSGKVDSFSDIVEVDELDVSDAARSHYKISYKLYTAGGKWVDGAPLASPADSVENDSCISDFANLSLEELEKFTVSDTR